MMRRVNWSITTRTQCVLKVADSHWNKSQLHILVLHVTEKRDPGRTSRIRFRPVTDAQDAANNILVDVDAESQRDLLGNAGAAPVGITPFHGNDGVDEFLLRSLRARPTPALGRKQQAVLSFFQRVVEIEQSRSLQNNGGAEDACWAQKRVHKPAIIRSAVRRLGARLRPRLRICS